MALSDDAYERLRSAIRDGAFAPGERIKLRELADAFDMSVTPVRDGLARLVAERVLEALPNRAVCVPRPTAEIVTEEIARIILASGSAPDIADEAAREGVWDLRRAGLEKVKNGMTSLQEVNSVTVE